MYTALAAQKTNRPQNVAIIMDGNGRWANRRHLPRSAGHAKGAESVCLVLEYCAKLGIGHLTLLAFSSENWKRPEGEWGAYVNLALISIWSKKTQCVSE